jgi:hypothetical protein
MPSLEQQLEKLENDLAVLRRRHADAEASIVELKRLKSPQLNLVRASRNKLARKIAITDRSIATRAASVVS